MVDIKGVLKSLIFVVQKATAPKSGVEFRQGSTGAIRSSLATSYDAVRRRATSPTFDQSEAWKLVTDTHTDTHFEILVQGSLRERWTKSKGVFCLNSIRSNIMSFDFIVSGLV